MIDYRREQLANGLRAIYVRTPGLKLAVAVVYVRMGPRFEAQAENGLSHLVEHMVFKGSERYPDAEAVSHEIDAIGAELNGATMPEYSEFLVTCHRRHLRRSLGLLAEIVLRPRFDPAHLETERRVVLEEMGQYRDILGDEVNIDELSFDLMWPTKGHHFSALGREANVARFTQADLAAHYHRFLQAANMVVCVAGDFPEAEIAEVLAEQFGGLRTGEPAACGPLEDGQREPRLLFRRARTRMDYVRLCHKACSYHDPRLHRVLIISDVLGGGVTSRLFSRLREREGLVYDVSASTTLFSDCGWVDVATTTSRTKMESTLVGMLDEARRLADESIGDAHLQTIKERVACQMEILEDSPPDVADWFGVREILLAPEQLASPTAEAERLKSVTADEIQAVARELFAAGRRSLVIVGPSSWRQRRRIRNLIAT